MNVNDKTFESDRREIELMLKYAPAYSEQNAINIKHKFEQKASRKQRKTSKKKFLIIGFAAAMLFGTTLVYAGVINLSNIYKTVFGENFEYVEQFIEPIAGTDINPEIAPSIQSEYDGIVIRLISAINDENDLKIFAAVTDTKADRLGESFDFTSWGLSQGYGGNISVVDYDSVTKTATIMITSLGSDHQGSATLTVDGISNGRELLTDLPENNIDIGKLLTEHTAEFINQDQVSVWGSSGGNGKNDPLRKASRLLTPDQMNLTFDHTDMFTISNIGFVDGIFHIQIKAALTGPALIDGYYINAKLADEDNKIIYDSSLSLSFIETAIYNSENNESEPHNEYTELIYEDITNAKQLNDLSLTIDYMKSPTITEGHWEFSFMVPNKVITEFEINQELPVNNERIMINTITLSPLGVTIHLPNNISAEYQHQDQVLLKNTDGTNIVLNDSSIHTYEDESTLIFSGPVIEVEQVIGIIINGESVDFRPLSQE